jgi:hypothetical protein
MCTVGIIDRIYPGVPGFTPPYYLYHCLLKRATVDW